MYMRVHVVHCAALSLGSVDSCDSEEPRHDEMSDLTSDGDRGISTCGT